MPDRKTVLVVDDHDDTRQGCAAFLERYGYRVVQAANGADGMRLARERSPDLILMDLGMPIMDGLTAARMLRQERETSGIPIVVLTAQALLRNLEEAQAVSDACLLKPVAPQVILQAVQGLIGTPDGAAR